MKLDTVYIAENLDFMQKMKSDFIDLIYIDPPFYSGVDYKEFSDKWSSIDEYLDFMFLRIKEIHRILKPGKHILILVPNLSFWRFRLEVLRGKIPYILQDPRHLHSFNKGFLLEKLAHSGFTGYNIYGQRQRIKWFASLSPSLFSEDLFVLAKKNISNS